MVTLPVSNLPAVSILASLKAASDHLPVKAILAGVTGLAIALAVVLHKPAQAPVAAPPVAITHVATPAPAKVSTPTQSLAPAAANVKKAPPAKKAPGKPAPAAQPQGILNWHL